MRLIDADALMNKVAKTIDYCEAKKMNRELSALFEVCDAVMDCPTIDAVPVVHGRWEVFLSDYDDCELMRCSCCGSEFYDGDNDTVDVLHNYCPNCGAKMEGADDNGD